MGDYKTILYHQDQGIAKVTLNRPEVRNAMNATMMLELTEVFLHLSELDHIRRIELSGSGKCFCSGADFAWMKSGGKLSKEENLRDSRQLSNMLQSLEVCPHIVTAKVHGAAMGGGLGLLACCDEVVATPQTVFRLPEVRLGLIPAMIAPFIFSKLSYSQALALTLSGRTFDSNEALQYGLIHRVLDNKNEEDPFKAYDENAPQASKVAKAFIKKHFKPTLSHDIHEVTIKTISELREQPEAQEGLDAILHKRVPSWTRGTS